MELLQLFAGGILLVGTQHRLRFVDDQDGICGSNHVDGLARTESIQLHVDATSILASGGESLRVDNHHVHVRVAGKLVDLRQLLRVVDEALDALAVFCGKVLAHNLERTAHTLTDGDAGHDDDELAPAVQAVQLVHRLDIGVGLACSRLHLYGQAQVAQHHGVRGFQLCIHLHGIHILPYIRGIEADRLIAEAYHVEHILYAVRTTSHIVGELQHRLVRLSLKHIRHRLCCVYLELLMLELQFHIYLIVIAFLYTRGYHIVECSPSILDLDMGAWSSGVLSNSLLRGQW